MDNLTVEEKASKYDRMMEIMTKPEMREALGIIADKVLAEPEIKRYRVQMSVIESNTYTVAIRTTSAERAMQLAKEHGVSDPSHCLEDGESYSYEFDSWAEGYHNDTHQDVGQVTQVLVDE